MSTPKRLHVFLSDQAYYGLLTRTASQCHSAKQITRLVRKLPTDPDAWVDTRPQDLQLSDQEFIDAGMPIMWSFEVPRYRRGLAATQEVIDDLVKLAETFCIQNHQRPVSGMGDHQRLSSLLEAIGLGFLSLAAYQRQGKD